MVSGKDAVKAMGGHSSSMVHHHPKPRTQQAILFVIYQMAGFEQLSAAKKAQILDELIRLRQFRTSNECASNYRPFLYAFYFKFCRPTDSPITARKCTFHSMAKY